MLKYLQIDGDIDLNALSTSDKEILGKAFKRISIIKGRDGIYKLLQNCGEEVKISENIYESFKKIVKVTNMEVESFTKGRTRFGIWDNDTTFDGDNEEAEKRVDCVVYSILGIMNDLGIEAAYTYDLVKQEFISAGYYIEGEGTIRMFVQNALVCFFRVESIDNREYSSVDASNGNYLVIRRTDLGDGHYGYHSETAVMSGGGGFMCRNDQLTADSSMYDFVGYSDIDCMFKLSKKEY